MSFKSLSKVLLFSISTAIILHFAHNFFAKKKRKVMQNAPKEVHEVLMFSPGGNELKRSKYSRVMISQPMERLLYHLNSARHSFDICMYVLTNLDLANAVLKLHYKGVKIRIIIDADMAFSSGSNIRKLEKQGIPVRWMKSTNLMHHKFCLIDSSINDSMNNMTNVTPLVISGSLNWTNQALNGNWEDIIVTSQPELIQQYKVEFERLWVQFTPVVELI